MVVGLSDKIALVRFVQSRVSMITDQIGGHEVLLPINHNYDMTFRAFLNKNTRNPKRFFCWQ